MYHFGWLPSSYLNHIALTVFGTLSSNKDRAAVSRAKYQSWFANFLTATLPISAGQYSDNLSVDAWIGNHDMVL